MSKKSELQEQVEALGIDPKGMTVADMESLLAEQAPKSETPEEDADPEEEDGPAEDVSKAEVTDAEEVKGEPAPVKKSMFAKREPSFTDKMEECMHKCANFVNKGGDEKEMRKYLKELAYY